MYSHVNLEEVDGTVEVKDLLHVDEKPVNISESPPRTAESTSPSDDNGFFIKHFVITYSSNDLP
jgi:hypothetical protein